MSHIVTQPRRLIASFGAANPEHLELLRQQTALERSWYADIPAYADNEEILAAVRSGTLIHVMPSTNRMLIARLRHERTDVDQLPFTSLASLAMATMLEERWRIYANAAGIDPMIRLSMTSLVRTLSYQRVLSGEDLSEQTEVRKLALPATESTHPKKKGGADDYDLAGYYHGYGKDLRSIRKSPPEQHAVIRRELIARLGEVASPILADPSEFNPEVTEALKAAATDMHNEGLVNSVVEYPGEPNECLHIAAHPDFLGLVA